MHTIKPVNCVYKQVKMFLVHSRLSAGLASLVFTAHGANKIHSTKAKALSIWALCNSLRNFSKAHCVTHNAFQTLSIWQKIKEKLLLTLRFLQLAAIFSPTIVLSPFYLIPQLRWIWMRAFAWGIEKAGVAWMKLFQFLSHRGDMVGEDLAEMFVYLREACPEHSFNETRKIFRRVYGMEVHEIFDSFPDKPFASGTVSQVYQAVYKGKKVAVKVRHPNVNKNINKDIAIGLWVSKLLSIFSKRFSIPLNEDILKKMLNDQIDFTKEESNLKKFRSLIINPDVSFPEPYPETTEEVLIMSFVEGKPITYYQQHQNPMNKFIARLAGTTFFQMLVQHNFLHADYHGGNIMVEIRDIDNSSIQVIAQAYWRMVKDAIWNKAIKLFLRNKLLRDLCDQELKQEIGFHREMLKMGKQVKISLIDVGMVLELEPDKRQYFVNFLSQLIEGDPSSAAEMIYRISKDQGKRLEFGEYPKYYEDLSHMFEFIQKVELQKLEGIDVLNGILRIIRKHSLKLDGQFATLLSNMLIVEEIVKKLYPSINIMRCIVPYLPYK